MVFKTILNYLTPLLRRLHFHQNMTAVVVYTDTASPEHEPRGSHQKNTTVTDRLWTSKILSASLSLRPPVRLAEQTWAAVDAKWHTSNETCVGLQWNQDKRLVEISAKVTAFAMLRMTLPEASGTPDMSHQSFSLTLRRCKYQRPAPCKDDWYDWWLEHCKSTLLYVMSSGLAFSTQLLHRVPDCFTERASILLQGAAQPQEAQDGWRGRQAHRSPNDTQEMSKWSNTYMYFLIT